MSNYYSHQGLIRSAFVCAQVLARVSKETVLPDDVRSATEFLSWVEKNQPRDSKTRWGGHNTVQQPHSGYNEGSGIIWVHHPIGNHQIDVVITDQGHSGKPAAAGEIVISFHLKKVRSVLSISFEMESLAGRLMPSRTRVYPGIDPTQQQRPLRLIKELVKALPPALGEDDLYTQMSRCDEMMSGWLALPFDKSRVKHGQQAATVNE